MCVYSSIHAYVGARWSPGVSPSITVHIMSLRHSPSLNLELTILYRLASRQALAISLPALNSTQVTGTCGHAWFFTVVRGLEFRSPLSSQQAHLPPGYYYPYSECSESESLFTAHCF